MNSEVRNIVKSFITPIIIVGLMWLVKLIEVYYNTSFADFGLIPLSFKGLRGVLFYPFIHGDFNHLISNSIPMLLLSAGLYYYYSRKANSILLFNYLLSGFLLWLFARGKYPHIGASGIVYALATFHFVSGILKKEAGQLAFGLLVVFLYGSLVWGVFPEFYPEMNISWEGHLMGIFSGVVTSVYYRYTGPQPRKYFEDETDEDIDNQMYPSEYWKSDVT